MAEPDVRLAVLNTIDLNPVISCDDIIARTGFPSFAVRGALQQLYKNRLIERTGKTTGIGRYCITGRRDEIFRSQLREAESFAVQGRNMEAVEILSRLRRGFLLDAEQQSRCDAIAQCCVLNELLALFESKKIWPVRLHCMTQQFRLSWQSTRVLIKPLMRRGILKKNSSIFMLSQDAVLP